MANPPFLIAGLGNPGTQYENTRHNVGFIFLDLFAERFGWQIDTDKMQGFFVRGRAFEQTLCLVKPQTYMNRSGSCIRAFMDYFKIPPAHLLVLHDDLDLPSGKVKVVRGGGAGGHNGIRSIVQHVGSSTFARIKIGIGRPPVQANGQSQAVDQFVLARLSQKELETFSQRQAVIEDAVELFVREGVEACMNSINGR